MKRKDSNCIAWILSNQEEAATASNFSEYTIHMSRSLKNKILLLQNGTEMARKSPLCLVPRELVVICLILSGILTTLKTFQKKFNLFICISCVKT